MLGVDPGMTRCGIGVVDGAPGRALTLVSVEVVRTASDAEVGSRLVIIADAIAAAIDLHAPDVVAVERVFSQHNVRTVMGTAQAAGLAIVAATRAGVPVALHTPSEVKASVTGSGTAGKDQVGVMVSRLLRLPDKPRPADAADALALAICQLWRGAAQARLVAAAGSAAVRGAPTVGPGALGSAAVRGAPTVGPGALGSAAVRGAPTVGPGALGSAAVRGAPTVGPGALGDQGRMGR